MTNMRIYLYESPKTHAIPPSELAKVSDQKAISLNVINFHPPFTFRWMQPLLMVLPLTRILTQARVAVYRVN